MARIIEIEIGCCGECPYYSMKKHKCQRGAADEGDPREHFFRDCPLPWHEISENDIAEKEFTLDDFSWEHLFTRDFQTYGIYDNDDQQTVYLQASALEVLNTVIQALNAYRRAYLVSQKANKALWWQMIQLLPQSYNQRATVQMNYEVLANMYHSRKNHKLDEWRKFCEWVGGLPYSVIITGNSDNA